MSTLSSSLPQQSRRKPIAACIASLFALSAPVAAVAANTWPVTSCADDGSGGTLRSVVSAVTTLSGDTVDLSTLSCLNSKISLVSSYITVAQNSLTIQGPGASALQIDGSLLPRGFPSYSRLFTHNGNGTLTIADLSLTGGYLFHHNVPSLGGCIYSLAHVSLTRAKVSSCTATSSYDRAYGGGVYTKGDLTLDRSTVSGNSASSGSLALGGGARVGGNLVASYSTISGNQAQALGSCVQTAAVGSNQAQKSGACGGGLNVAGSVSITASTISGNSSSGRFGGIDAYSPMPAANTFTLVNSTISGNTAADAVGGAYVNSAAARFYNSTIAFNTAVVGHTGASMPYTFYSPGLELSARYVSMALTLKSTLISNNTYAASENDLSANFVGLHSITVNSAPANNFVRTTFVTGLPSDTLQGSCPLLGPLRNNGGLTQTHALLSHSPAIDAGNNISALSFDQRGLPNVRVSGPPGSMSPRPDIGAYEVNQADIVFNANFEGCP